MISCKHVYLSISISIDYDFNKKVIFIILILMPASFGLAIRNRSHNKKLAFRPSNSEVEKVLHTGNLYR